MRSVFAAFAAAAIIAAFTSTAQAWTASTKDPVTAVATSAAYPALLYTATCTTITARRADNGKPVWETQPPTWAGPTLRAEAIIEHGNNVYVAHSVERGVVITVRQITSGLPVTIGNNNGLPAGADTMLPPGRFQSMAFAGNDLWAITTNTSVIDANTNSRMVRMPGALYYESLDVISEVDANGIAYVPQFVVADKSGGLWTAGTVWQGKTPVAGRLDRRNGNGVIDQKAEVDLRILDLATDGSGGLVVYGANVQGGALEVLALTAADLSTRWSRSVIGEVSPGRNRLAGGAYIYVTAKVPRKTTSYLHRIPLTGGTPKVLAQIQDPADIAANAFGYVDSYKGKVAGTFTFPKVKKGPAEREGE